MNSGKCNLILIKTCCWHQPCTDRNFRLSSPHPTPPSPCDLRLSSNTGSLSFLRVVIWTLDYFLSPSPPVLIMFSVYSCHPLPSMFFFSNFSSFPLCVHILLQSQHHEEEKRALSREIIVLNNHLMEAKMTINKLREDNVGTHERNVTFPPTSLTARGISRLLCYS